MTASKAREKFFMVWTWHFMASHSQLFWLVAILKSKLFNAVLLLAKLLLESESEAGDMSQNLLPYLIPVGSYIKSRCELDGTR